MAKQRKTKALNVQVWNLNGGPLPENVTQEVTEAIEKLVKGSENPRLMMHVEKV